MARLRADLNAVARALEFIILCGSRSSEVTCMTWQEIDFEARVWRIPAERMKARKEHHVPLPDEALDLLRAVLRARQSEPNPDDLVFVSEKGKRIWDAALTKCLRTFGYSPEEATVHGFRSSLRTWLTEQTAATTDVAESVLAHDKRSNVQQAYERTRFYEQRVPLMAAWTGFLGTVE